MARVDITQAEIMEIIIDFLRTKLMLNERQCYETVSPLTPPLTPLSEWWLSVSPGEGSFDEAMQSGGGRDQVTEEWQLLVTGYTRIRLDSTDRDMQVLREANRGLLQLKRKILGAMSQIDLVKQDGDTFLRKYLVVSYAGKPEYDEKNQVGWLSVFFKVSHDWDLECG